MKESKKETLHLRATTEFVQRIDEAAVKLSALTRTLLKRSDFINEAIENHIAFVDKKCRK